jgi:5-oxoprolinase (ATP-hydrolysing)
VARQLDLRPGDMAVTNHPGAGGSHLPDITVVSPVFSPHDGELLGYVANRAHHAEIGGVSPGSMAPGATCLAEEGVVIAPRYLYRAGRERFDSLAAVLANAAHPTRNPADNLADLRAQAAANLDGARRLAALAGQWGDGVVRHQLAALATRAATALRARLGAIGPFDSGAVERLDDGTVIQVHVRSDGERMEIGFAGTSGVHPGSFNATPGIVRSAVLYAVRLLVGDDLPLNEGFLEPVTIDLPPCFLNPPFPDNPAACPAVAAGNVESSQRLVDTLLKALALQACSQGTMNNVTFGDETFGYYETLGGGAGAGRGYRGASGLHTHMTNTAITDAEVIESRYPVRIERFGLRHGSGGPGKWLGGDGLVREYRFLRPLTVSLLTQHRTETPYGLAGGGDGKRGRQTLIPADGSDPRELPPATTLTVTAGDLLRVETPGGGGFGTA